MAGNKTGRLEGRTGQVWQMTIAGHTQQAIAEVLGISQSNVSRILAEARKEIPQQTREEIVQERLDLLRSITAGITEAAQEGDRDAIAAILKIQEREAKLLGLDSAVKQEVDATVRYEIAGVDEGDV